MRKLETMTANLFAAYVMHADDVNFKLEDCIWCGPYPDLLDQYATCLAACKIL